MRSWHARSAGALFSGLLVPQVPVGGITGSLVFLVMAIVGTTIAPWQLFFQQSCVADKRLRFRDLNRERLDTGLGAIFTIVNAGAMMLIGNVLFTHGIPYTDPAQMAVVLGPIMGNFVTYGVLLLMVNAAVLGAMAITLASAWAFGEVMGWPHSLQKPIREAPGFYAVYVGGVVAAAAIVLIPNAPLQLIILGVQVLAGLMLPSAIILLQLLLNDRELLGRLANKSWNNWLNWIIIAVLVVLSAILAVQVLLPALFPGRLRRLSCNVERNRSWRHVWINSATIPWPDSLVHAAKKVKSIMSCTRWTMSPKKSATLRPSGR